MSGSHGDRQLIFTGITKHYSAGLAQNLKEQRPLKSAK
jgi:hypothetical protein